MPKAALQRFTAPDLTPGQAYFGLKTGRVIQTHWENGTIDVLLGDGSVLQYVHVLQRWAGTDYGEWALPQLPPLRADAANVLDQYGLTETGIRDTYALIALVEGFATTPICVGFYYPDSSEMMFENLQKLTRNLGDTYSAVALNGTHWLAFDQDGTGISINSNDYAATPNLEATDYDRRSRPASEFHSLTLFVRGGTLVHLDGKTKDIVIHAEADIAMSGDGAVDIAGNPLTLSGLTGLYF